MNVAPKANPMTTSAVSEPFGPAAAKRSIFMKILLTSAYASIAILVLCGCSAKPPTDAHNAKSAAEHQLKAKNALAAIQNSPVIVDMKGDSILATWLSAEIKTRGKHFGNIREARLKRVNERDNTYGMSLHKAHELSPISEGSEYIEIHFIHDVSDPEIHGIVDPTAPKLLSIFEDGGA
jgi:hypothetical protein